MGKVTKFQAYLLENFDTDLEEAKDFEKLCIFGCFFMVAFIAMMVI